ncbi:hypothetical protein ABVT39_006758 [Epinephelus coioides]
MDPSCGLTDDRASPPNSLNVSPPGGGGGGGMSSTHRKRRTLVAPEMNLSLDQSEGSLLSDDFLDTPDDLDINVDDIDTPDETDSLEFITNGNELEWEDDTPVASAKAGPADGSGDVDGEGNANNGRLWRTVIIGEQEHRIDMQVIRPYLRVITHGGYYGEGLNAIIVFSACYLPDSSCPDYHYIMENLFLYVVSSLEMLVAEDYLIIYMNGATPRSKMPGISWLKKCYQMIDRRLRKNLKSLVIAHPTWFIRTVLAISRPFISVKFMNKIQYVHSLDELAEIVPMEHVHVPECVVQVSRYIYIQTQILSVDRPPLSDGVFAFSLQIFTLILGLCGKRMEHEPLVLSPYEAVGPTSLCASIFNQHPADDLCCQDGKCSVSLIPLRGTPSLSLPDGFILQLENVRWKSALCYRKCVSVETIVGFIDSLTCCVVGPVVSLLLYNYIIMRLWKTRTLTETYNATQIDWDIKERRLTVAMLGDTTVTPIVDV